MREKLIELLQQNEIEFLDYLNRAADAAINGDAWDRMMGRIEFTADHLIANGVTVQKWIPVTERLPEDDKNIRFYDDGRLRCTTVLAYTEYGRTIPKNRLLVRATGNEWLDTQVTDGWEWSSGTGKVTHWMPLPSPPSTEVSE